ncbi:unnamed protein product [Prunus brigantina]
MGILNSILKFKLRIVFYIVIDYFEDLKEMKGQLPSVGSTNVLVSSYFESYTNLVDIRLNFSLENDLAYVLICAICFLERLRVLFHGNVILIWLRPFIPVNICVYRIPLGFMEEPLIVSMFFQDPLQPLVLGGDHSIYYPVVRVVSEKLGGPVDILHFDAYPDIYNAFEGNECASSFARIMEGGYARRLLQVLKKEIDPYKLRWYGYCMFRALACLHKQIRSLQDVKPGNFLFSRKLKKAVTLISTLPWLGSSCFPAVNQNQVVMCPLIMSVSLRINLLH